MLPRFASLSTMSRRALPNHWDLIAMAIIFSIIIAITKGAHGINAPLPKLEEAPTIDLSYWNLPYYAIRSVIRMAIAMAASFVFTFTYATWAAKSRRAEMVLIPMLDVLQSVPVLSFLTITVTFFTDTLFPGSTLGVECAAIFAIFTAQAWNMAFSFYQSLRTVPHDLSEVADGFHLTGWQKFWNLETPFAVPGLLWNTMMSMSGSWFFLVASEAITVHGTTVKLPGIGSYLATAIDAKDWGAVIATVITMFVVILIYDQLLFRPVVAWADKFRVELSAAQTTDKSWLLDLLNRTRWVRHASRPVQDLFRRFTLLRIDRASIVPKVLLALLVVFWLYLARHVFDTQVYNDGTFLLALLLIVPMFVLAKWIWAPSSVADASPATSRLIDIAWFAIIVLGFLYAAWEIASYVSQSLSMSDVWETFWLTCYTLARVAVLMLLATIFWVPVSVWIGLRPRLASFIQPAAQFLAAYPVNLLFPIAVPLMAMFNLNPDIWLSPLIVFGTQWYIVFNVVAGASAFPNDLREVSANFHIKGWQWWKNVILPGIMPYYFTGAITASGGSWNAAIVAETVKWGDQTYSAHGIGAYIADASASTDDNAFQKVVLGTVMMSIFVILFNRLFWRRLYAYAERKLRVA
ncbi:ABC transporter permease [Methylovirgula sp. 4M-Z18]|uniref:ABC transporter permease n=1 Tax=Methylovirgula sp. 4M-Z18 TaxID=2293567 RepID=UPI000E2E9922|nr:ABC transporter permease subunit [Methylovirgula sp. 4M-Z18]RFB80049.1 ABC transporter permease subunit [Methylovirgula sp. 4M-Z18]